MRSKLPVIGLVVLATGFVAGTVQLIRTRYANGAVYPPFSSFRSDPAGAKLLYDSLTLLPGVEATRNVEPLAQRTAKGTLLLMGMSAHPSAGTLYFKDLEKAAADGCRVVVAYSPVWPRNDPPGKASPVDQWKGLGVSLQWPQARASSERRRISELPRESALYFDHLTSEWTVMRSDDGRAVMVERPWKKGSLVLVADSWPLSNEGLMTKPETSHLSALIGGHRRVIFDETHLGTVETGSVAGLMRRYGLHAFLAAVLCLAALLIWSRSSPFLPAVQRVNDREIEGRSSLQGLAGLLQRSVPEDELMAACLREFEAAKSLPSDQREAARQAAAQPLSNLVQAYEHVRHHLAESSRPWKKASNS